MATNRIGEFFDDDDEPDDDDAPEQPMIQRWTFYHRFDDGRAVTETDYAEADSPEEWSNSAESKDPSWSVWLPRADDDDQRVRAVRATIGERVGSERMVW